jgi:hypothetical protein
MNNKKTKLEHLFLLLLILQAGVNLIGVLGPELGFDALWYHLTEAKLFLDRRSLAPIPGNLLYWSGLPRFGELIYAIALKLWDERLTKLIHWFFGVLSAWLIYHLARRQTRSSQAGLGASLLFYSTLLVGWLSTTSYIDLIVTAFLLAALTVKHWWARGLALILAGATKLHAITYGLVISLVPWALLGILPFWLINLKTTANPVYPFLQNFGFEQEWFYHGFWYWFSRPIRLFFDPVFRVGPGILLLLLFLKKNQSWRQFQLTTGLAFLVWFLGPGTGFGRFALFPLAHLSINASRSFSNPKTPLRATLSVLAQASLGITGRSLANAKYLPVIFQQQTKTEFLSQNLNFEFGDFYDIDGYFKKNIKPSDKVLVYAIHNLYYIDFPFDHHTWLDPTANYTHILVGDNQPLPKKHGNLPLLYQNHKTRVKLYLNESAE